MMLTTCARQGFTNRKYKYFHSIVSMLDCNIVIIIADHIYDNHTRLITGYHTVHYINKYIKQYRM